MSFLLDSSFELEFLVFLVLRFLIPVNHDEYIVERRPSHMEVNDILLVLVELLEEFHEDLAWRGGVDDELRACILYLDDSISYLFVLEVDHVIVMSWEAFYVDLLMLGEVILDCFLS